MRTYKSVKAALSALALLGVASSLHAASIGVSFFRGTPDDTNSADLNNTQLTAAEVAGVVPQANWNNVNARPDPHGRGTAASLKDDSGAVTTVSVLYRCNDSWISGGGESTGDEKMMKGIIKAFQPDRAYGYFDITGLNRQHSYDLYAYTVGNTGGGQTDVNLWARGTTNYIREMDGYFGSYILAENTDPAAARPLGNYVRFQNLVPNSANWITLNFKWMQNGSDGAGIAGLQIVDLGVDTLPPAVIAVRAHHEPGPDGFTAREILEIDFNKDIDPSTVLAANFTLGAGVIQTARLGDSQTVMLTVDSLFADDVVTINNLKAANGATIAANTQAPFKFNDTDDYLRGISVNMIGGADDARPVPPVMDPGDVAGLFPLPNWNNAAQTMQLVPLNNSLGVATPVTISFRADGSWRNNPAELNKGTPGDQKMLMGMWEALEWNGGTDVPMRFDNVPFASYNVIAYNVLDAGDNGNGANGSLWWLNNDQSTTVKIKAQWRGDFNGTWIRGVGTNNMVCNYVMFEDVTPVAGTMTVDLKADTFRGRVNGLQLVPIPPVPLVIVSEPADQLNMLANQQYKFSTVVTGLRQPYWAQWYSNGVPIVGATGTNLVGIASPENNNAQFQFVATNELNAVTSRVALLTVQLNSFLLSAGSQGNCHAVYCNFNLPMNLNGTYTVSLSNNVPGAVIHTENFNAGDGGYTVETPLPYLAPWGYNATSGSWTNGGQAPDNAQQNTSYLISPAIVLAAGGPLQLTFAHRYSFETGGGFWDGGVVQYSVNGGAFTTIPSGAFTLNGYNAVIAVNTFSAISGQAAFGGNSANYATATVSSICTFGSFVAGDSVRVRFMAASDANTAGEFQPSWEVDSIQINAVVPGLTPLTVGTPAFGSSQSQIVLPVSPDLLPTTNLYVVSVTGATAQNGLPVAVPSEIVFVHGSDYPFFNVAFRKYNGVGGGNLANFYSSSKYINNQYDVQTLNPMAGFEAVPDQADQFSAILFGWYIAPTAGTYYFWMSSDDQGATYIATDANPAHKVQIANEPSWSGSREYASSSNTGSGRGTPPSNGSVGIPLSAGQMVYLEGDYSEGGGGDNYSATVVVDNSTAPANGTAPIPTSNFLQRRMSPNGYPFNTLCDVFFVQPLGTVTGYVTLPITITAQVDGTPAWAPKLGYWYQWSSNGIPIVGATNATYTTAATKVSDTGVEYTCVASNNFSTASSTATVFVSPRPIVLSVSTLNQSRLIQVVYTVPVQLNGTYTITNSVDTFMATATAVGYGAAQNIVMVEAESDIPEGSVSALTATDVTAVDGISFLTPNPTTVVFTQGPAGKQIADFTTLPANAVLNGSATLTDNSIHLTEAINSIQGSVVFTVGQPVAAFNVKYKLLMGDSTAGQADGSSFSFAPDVNGSFGEGGSGTGLTVAFNTYAGYFRGIRLLWNGAEVARAPMELAGTPAVWRDVEIELTTSGYITVRYNGSTVFNGLKPNNYAPLTGNAKFGFGGRCGGENQKNYIDDVFFNDYPLGQAVTATISPVNPTIAECGTLTFSSTVAGTPYTYYQWLKNGVAIPGATAPNYTTPKLFAADNGAVFALQISNLFSSVTAPSTVTVTIDNTPPTLVSAGSTSGNAIGAQFSEDVDSATATNPLNYSVNGAPFGENIAGVSLMPSNNAGAVIIGLSNAVSTTFTLTASNIFESCPARNATNSTVTGGVLGLTASITGVLGNPSAAKSTNASFGSNELVIVTGGGDNWDAEDHNQFDYTQRCGDFDIQVKVARLDYQSGWTKAGIQARVTLAANSPVIETYCTPTNGANQVESGLRTTFGGGTSDWGTIARPSASLNPWIRLQRVGDVFKAYSSANGADWVNHATTTLCGTPTNLYVGFFATPNNGNNGNTTTAEFVGIQVSQQGVCAPKTSCGPVRVSYDLAGNVTVTWDDPCCRLQGAEVLDSNPASTVWTDVPGTSPLTLPAGTPAIRYFRTISP